MLDSHSIDIISRFKEAVVSRAVAPTPAYDLGVGNRGNKSNQVSRLTNPNALQTKVVEYDGDAHLVLTNEAIAKQTYRNKRKWLEFYDVRKRKKINGDVSRENITDTSDESSSEEEEEDAMRTLRLTEILAPLAHPSEVVLHPAILKTFKLNVLNKLAQELIDLIEVEQKNLNWLNKMFQVLNGEDWFYLLEEQLGLEKYDHGLVQEEEKPEPAAPVGDVDDNKRITRGLVAEDVPSTQTKITDPFFSLPKTLTKYEEHQAKYFAGRSEELVAIQEELVNYLQVGIQRQNEYIKTLTQLRNGLVKVDRYRQDLHKWGKEMHDKKSN